MRTYAELTYAEIQAIANKYSSLANFYKRLSRRTVIDQAAVELRGANTRKTAEDAIKLAQMAGLL